MAAIHEGDRENKLSINPALEYVKGSNRVHVVPLLPLVGKLCYLCFRIATREEQLLQQNPRGLEDVMWNII